MPIQLSAVISLYEQAFQLSEQLHGDSPVYDAGVPVEVSILRQERRAAVDYQSNLDSVGVCLH